MPRLLATMSAILVGTLVQSSSPAIAQANGDGNSLNASADLIGKHLLVGVTYLDANDNVVEQYQTHGDIVAVDDKHGIVIERPNGTGRYAIPPDIASLHVAPRGKYRLRSTGEVVVDPDFTSTWDIRLPADATREENMRTINSDKIAGFVPKDD